MTMSFKVKSLYNNNRQFPLNNHFFSLKYGIIWILNIVGN